MAPEDAARACTAQIQTRVSGEIEFRGSGFFVGRGLLLTCSHVVSDRQDANLVAVWAGKEWPCEVIVVLPDPFPKDARLGDSMPDLALLHCGAGNHQALLLDPETPIAPDADYLFYGFSKEADGEIVGHPLRCPLDGRIDVQPDWQLLQFNTARVLKGMSGCAILWEQSGRVVAIAKRRLGGDFTACYGVPAATVLTRLPAVETEQRAVKIEVAARESSHRLLSLPSPNTFFAGRKAESRDLVRALRAHSVTAIVGPEAIGKSALAREYLLDALSEYEEALWLDAASVAGLRQSLFAVSQQLGIELRGKPPADTEEPYKWLGAAARQIYDWLELGLDPLKQRWLLVLDGIQDIRLGQALLPKGQLARMLITSRLDDLRALRVRNPVRLGPLAAGEARELVSTRLGPVAEKISADAITARSDGLPAMLERSAAMALEVGLSTGAFPDTVPDTVAFLVNMLNEPAPGSLLRLASVLAEAPLPLTVLFQSSGVSARSVHALTSVSLARLDPASDWLGIVPEVRQIVRQRLSSDELVYWQMQARGLLLVTFSREAHQADRPKLSPSLIPHAQHLLESWVPGDLVAEDVLLRAYTAGALNFMGDHVSAEQLLDAAYEKVAQPGAARFGIAAIAEYLLRLAAVKMEVRGPLEAERVLDQAERQLRSYDLLEGEGPSDLAEFILQECAALRGSIRVAQGRYEEAARLFDQALSYFVNHERGALRAAYTLQSLMDCLMRWGRVANALHLLPRVAEALQRTPTASEAHSRVWLYLGIACIRTAGNQHPGKMVQLWNARMYLERALTIAESTLPKNNEITASCCINLAIVLRMSKDFGQGDDLKAVSYLERGIGIYCNLYGPRSPLLKIAHYNLGVLQAEAGQFDTAEANLLAVRNMPAELGDGIRRGALAELAKVYDHRHDEKRLHDVQRELTVADREAARLPKRPPHPGESSHERNAAFLLAAQEVQRQAEESGQKTMFSHGMSAGDFRAALDAGRVTPDAAVSQLHFMLNSPPHLLALIQVLEPRTAELSPEMRGELAVLHAVGLVEAGKYPQALEVAERALADAQLPRERQAELFNAKGRALFHLRNYERSAEAYRAGIATSEPDGQFVAQLLINLGNAIHADVENPKRDLAAATEVLQQAVTLATDPRLRVEARSSLSTVLIDASDLKRAQLVLEEAWIMAQSDQPVYDKARMAVLRNLGVVQFLQGDAAAGRKAFDAAIERGMAHFGLDHPEMIELQRYIFGFYAAVLSPREAVEKALRALQATQRACGVASPAIQEYMQIALGVAAVAAQRLKKGGRLTKFQRLLAKSENKVLDDATLAQAVKSITG